MKNPIGTPSSALGSRRVERVSGGGAGDEVAPYTPSPIAIRARNAQAATRILLPSALNTVPNTACVSGQPAAPHVRS